MRVAIVRLATTGSLFLWIIIFPLTSLLFLMQYPPVYVKWIRTGDVRHKVMQGVALHTLKNIPPDQWSPWINRHPDTVYKVLEHAVDPATFETVGSSSIVCWSRWWMGELQKPCRTVSQFIDTIDEAQWERIRAYLWETLPTCSQALSLHCKPDNLADYAGHGLPQSAWWEDYRVELTSSLQHMEDQVLAGLPEYANRRYILYTGIAITKVLTLVSLILTRSEKRIAYMSILLVGMSAGSLVAGSALAYGWVHSAFVWRILGIQPSGIFEILIPQIWPRLAYILGLTLLSLSCLIAVPGFVGLSTLFAKRPVRVLLSACAFLALLCVFIVFPDTGISRLPALSRKTGGATPTPWPTLTPILTPRHTTVPVTAAWPVLEGTPLPPVAGGWWVDPQVLRCHTVEGLLFAQATQMNEELWVVVQNKVLRFHLSTLERLQDSILPRTYEVIALSPAEDYAALSAGRDVWIYTLPDWAPVIRSRVSAVSQIRVLMFSEDGSQLIMGLDNGNIWIIDTRTGELVALASLHKSAVTTLAKNTSLGFVYSGSADGTIHLWDKHSTQAYRTFAGHNAPVEAISDLAGSSLLLTLDSSGRYILWDSTSGRALKERTVAEQPTVHVSGLNDTLMKMGGTRSITGVDGGYNLGGTARGQLYMVDSALHYYNLAQFDNSITVLYPLDIRYLVVGTANGQLCFIGTPK